MTPACTTDLCSWENLWLAYRKAAKGKRGHGNVAAFEHRLEENLLRFYAANCARRLLSARRLHQLLHPRT